MTRPPVANSIFPCPLHPDDLFFVRSGHRQPTCRACYRISDSAKKAALREQRAEQGLARNPISDSRRLVRQQDARDRTARITGYRLYLRLCDQRGVPNIPAPAGQLPTDYLTSAANSPTAPEVSTASGAVRGEG